MGYAHTSLRDFSRRKIDSTTADLQLQKSKAKDKKGQGSAASAVKRKFGQERAKNCRHRQRLETISRALGRKQSLQHSGSRSTTHFLQTMEQLKAFTTQL
jgi:hypothetical protein